MSTVSKEEIARAKEVDLYSYLAAREPQELVENGPGQYCTASHDSLKIRNGLWYWNREKLGGRTALDFLIKVRGMAFVDAVRDINGGEIEKLDMSTSSSAKPLSAEKEGFALPVPNKNNRHVRDYLTGRGISSGILEDCFSAGILYESKEYYNCVFVGRNAENIPRYAALRGTYSTFHGEAEGSDKSYGFCYKPKSFDMAACHKLIVCESPIDALSCATLAENKSENAAYLSLGGTAPLALWQYIETRKNIQCVEIRLDNDKAGNKASEDIRQQLIAAGYPCIRSLPSDCKDWNALLMSQNKLKKPPAKARGVEEER